MIGDTPRASALGGFRSAGRGIVVTFDDQDEVRYWTIENLGGALAEAPELKGLLGVARHAIASYDPEREAVVLQSGPETVSVYVVREAEIVALGSLAFVMPA